MNKTSLFIMNVVRAWMIGGTFLILAACRSFVPSQNKASFLTPASSPSSGPIVQANSGEEQSAPVFTPAPAARMEVESVTVDPKDPGSNRKLVKYLLNLNEWTMLPPIRYKNGMVAYRFSRVAKSPPEVDPFPPPDERTIVGDSSRSPK